MSKSKYRFTNLLKKHNAEKSNAGRSSESGFGGTGSKGAGVSRFGSGMGLGTYRYKGDYDSDGDGENYSDDEDTGYLLLGNAEHLNKLNAEGETRKRQGQTMMEQAVAKMSWKTLLRATKSKI